jgi:geranylgeranyl reductase family protein
MELIRYAEKYDVVVVGAGPAGAMTGYFLAQEGLKTLIIDKKKFPRYKACGGGLTKRAMDLLPFDIKEIIEDYAFTANIYIEGKLIAGKKSSFPLIGMVMRDRFDDYLVQKASSLGAKFEDNKALLSISGTPGNVLVETTGGNIRTKVIVGADGANSRVAGQLNLNGSKRYMTAVEAEVLEEAPREGSKLKAVAHFDFGMVRNGYGWVFPKQGHLSIGVMTTNKKAVSLKRHFNHYLATKVTPDRVTIRSFKGHRIPFKPDWEGGFSDSKGLLVGDAAGITDPVTGEGIYYALREARLAAGVIKAHIKANRPLSDYDVLLKEAMKEEITCAQKFADILYKIPGMSHRIMKSHANRIANNHIRIIIGEKTYTRLYKEVFSLSGLRTLFFAKDE